MSDIQALSASIGADVAQFLAGMQQAAAGINQLVAAQQQAQQASKDLADETGKSTIKWAAMGAVLVEAARELVHFGEAAIDAANAMDPAGGREWVKNVHELEDTFKTLSATLGKELRPALESLMQGAIAAMKFVGRIDFAKLLSDAKYAFNEIGNGLSDFASWLFDWAKKIGGWLAAPWIDLKNTAIEALSGLIDKMAELADIAKDAGLGPGGDALRSAAQTVRDLGKVDITGGILDGLDSAGVAVRDFFGNAVKTAVDAYVKPEDSFKVQQFAHHDDNQALQEQAAQVEALKALHRRIAMSDMEDARTVEQLRIHGAEQEYAIRRAAAAEEAETAKSQYDQAKSQLSQLESNGAGPEAFAQARAAIETAYSRVQAAGAVSLTQDQQRLRDLQTQLGVVHAKEQAAANAELAARMDEALKEQAYRQASEEVIALIRAGVTGEELEGAKAREQLAQAEANSAATALSEAARQHAQALNEQAQLGDAYAKGQAQVDKDHVDSVKNAADYQLERARQAAAVTKVWIDMAKGALQSIGGSNLNSVVSAGAQASAAGPAAMAAAGALALLEQSKQAKATADALNGVLQELADLLGKLLEPLAPLIRLIGDTLAPTFKEIGDVAKPLIGIIVEVLVPVLLALQPVLRLLAALLENLVPVFNMVAMVIRAVIDGIAYVWNGLIDIVQSVLYELGHILPSKLGDAATAAGDSLNQLKINVDSLNTAMVNAAEGITKAFDATLHGEQYTANQASSGVDAAHQAAVQASQNYAQSQQKVQGDRDHLAALQNAMAQTTDPAMLAELKKEYDAAQQQLQLDEDANNIMGDLANIAAAQLDYQKANLEAVLAGNELAQAYRDNNQDEIAKAIADNNQATQDFAGANQALTDATNQLHKDQTKQALDQAAATVANTHSTAANTKAINDLNASLTNAPSGFRLAMYEGAAAAASSASGPSWSTPGATLKPGMQTGALGGKLTGGTTVTGPINITIVTSDPKQAGQALEDTLRKRTFQSSGAPVVHHGGLFGG